MFVPLCKVADLREEGELYRFDVRDKPLLVVKFNGSVFVTDSTCTHQEADLSLGMFDQGIVKCPLHGAEFRLDDGDVISGPDGGSPSEIPKLRVYHVKIENGMVLVDLS